MEDTSQTKSSPHVLPQHTLPAQSMDSIITAIQQSKSKKPLLIGVTGGTASERIGLNCTYISLDSFYKGLSEEDHENAHNYNFDHPNALDFDCAYEIIQQLLEGKDCKIPIYDFTSHGRVEGQYESVQSSPIIIFEGILSLYDFRIRDLMDVKIFVLTDDDIRLARRLLRDCSERGRTIDGVLFQYNRFVKKAYDEYIKPTMKYANIIVPFGSDNTTAIDFIVQNLRSKLKETELRREQSFVLDGKNYTEDEVIEQSLEKDVDVERFQKTLGFEIVDYAIDYIGFKKSVIYFEAGNQENFKLEIMIRQLITYESPMIVDVFINYFSNQLNILLDRSKVQDKFFIQTPEHFYFEEALEQGDNKNKIKEADQIFLFYPELLEKHALKELRSALDSIQQIKQQLEPVDFTKFKINVGVYFCSIWILQELKSHALFKNLNIYTLSLNDKLKEYPILTVMEQYSPDAQIWEDKKKKYKVNLLGAEYAQSMQEVQLTSKLCYKQFFESREKKSVIERNKKTQ
eukprot:403330634